MKKLVSHTINMCKRALSWLAKQRAGSLIDVVLVNYAVVLSLRNIESIEFHVYII